MEHPPLDLLHPVPFRGDVARQLTIANLGARDVERQVIKAARKGSSRRAIVVVVAAATNCPRALISALSVIDLVRAGDWVAEALEREGAQIWHR